MLYEVITINEKNEIYSLGAVFGERIFKVSTGTKISRSVINEFAEFGQNADYVLGHNILTHDSYNFV